MNKKKIILLCILMGTILANCTSMGSKLIYYKSDYKLEKVQKILYLMPYIIPEIEEIKYPTNQVFSETLELFFNNNYNGIKIVKIDQTISDDNINIIDIKELIENNEAQIIIIPKIKYFKVGLGKYVFSNQVIIGLKLYDQKGNLLIETEYDTYKGNARLIGKAENSIKIGTTESLKELIRNLHRKKMF